MSEHQQPPALKGSPPCMKCCKPRRCPESTEAPKSKKSSSPLPNPSTNTESCQDIIKSPLDQRSYKSITLANGVRVMLISTFNVENEDEEIDATKPPCQVPELSEFNKTYLGYDNPAAKVKCACPCDKGKPCCGRGSKEESRKGILKDIEANIKATCCGGGSTHSRPSEEKKVSFDENLNQFRNAIERQSNPDELINYQNTIFNELQKRADRIKSIVDGRRKSKIFQQSSAKLPDEGMAKATIDSTISGGIQQLERSGASNLNENRSETHLDHLDEGLMTNSTLFKHYPQPPSHSEGLHCVHPYPVGSSRRPTSNRPQLTSPYNSDLDGTVYLVIGTGYFDDPEDQPGLAHFCEHAVFLGSNKFPEPNQLFKLVLPYEGYVNAYTSGMMTTFVTSASFRLFPLAVEILGDMVGFPLFPNSLVAAELEALDSEYSLRQDDTPRYFQLVGSLAKNGHVMRKMDSGNMSTLTVPNFYRKLVEWRRIYYNPSRMTVALEAPFPIDYLERLAISSFGKIASAALPHINRHLLVSSPFEMNRFHQIYHVPSVYHSEFLALHWALEAKAWKSLRVKPLEVESFAAPEFFHTFTCPMHFSKPTPSCFDQYLGAIIGHKSDGGLFHYLTTQGLATNVEAGCWDSDVTKNHFTSVFSISVDMTDKGFRRQDNILQAVFGYIQMLINNGPQKSFFQELQKQQLDSFHYQAAENGICIGESCTRWMQFIPPKWCLISPALMAEFDDKAIQRYTESLKVETANVIIFSKNYRSVEYMRNMEEFYNTPFAAFHFPPELEEKMHRTKDEYSKKFTLPVPNPLLLGTKCNRSRQQDMLQKGTLLKIKGKLVVQYVSRNIKITRGLLPQAKYTFWIGSPTASYVGAPEGNSTKMIIWSRLFNEIFKTKFYHASNADIQLETEVSQGELHIILAGPHTMLPSLMEQTLQLFNDFENVLDPVQFEVVRTAFIENLDNTILDNRFLAWDLFYYLWTNNHDLIFDHKRYAERLTFNHFLAFVHSFKTKMYIQGHLYGYVTKSHGEKVVNALTKLNYSPIDIRQYVVFRCLRVPLGERVVKISTLNPNIHTSVVINSYQFGQLTSTEEIAMRFFTQTMSDAAFYQLRTEQQLGYIIIIYAEVTFGVSSIIVELVTQPKNFTTDYCNECIDKFLMDFFIDNLVNQEAFEEFSLGKPKLELPFPVIQNLFASHLLPNPFTYRKLSIQVVGTIDSTSSHTKNLGKSNESTQILSSKARESRMDETSSSKVYRSQSLGARTTIDRVRTAKKAMKIRDDSIVPSRGRNKSSGITTKVIDDLAKFKSSLMYFPKLFNKPNQNQMCKK